MTQPAPPPVEVDGSGVPIFGRRSTPLAERRYRRFGLEVETTDDRFDVTFEAYLDPDAGAVMHMMNARTDMQQANAVAVLLGTSLRDDDGVPSGWHPPAEPAYDDDGNVLRSEYGSIPHPEGEPLYEWHDGTLLTAAEQAEQWAEFDPLTEGSSRRRFQYVMDSPHHRVQLAALNEVAEWIVGDLAARPTRRPTPSQRGPARTARGRGGR